MSRLRLQNLNVDARSWHDRTWICNPILQNIDVTMRSMRNIQRCFCTTTATAASATTTTALPPSPLNHHKTGHEELRTGYTHLFPGLSPTIDRTPAIDFRRTIRSEQHTTQTSGKVPGFVQANFVALPKEHAFDFAMFALRNPKACPILAITEPGNPCPSNIAPTADLRTDIPKYQVWHDGVLTEETTNITNAWTPDMVGFLLGCSFSWEDTLKQAGHCPRHMEEQCNVPMYRTNVLNRKAGPFGGHLVVSMRPYKAHEISNVASITECYPGAHGGPVHWGDPTALGISITDPPHWGDAVFMSDKDDVPVFWACGITPQTAIMEAKLPLVITHAPGHMFVCDVKDHELYVEGS